MDKRQKLQGPKTERHLVIRPRERKAISPEREIHKRLEKAERLQASMRAKVRSRELVGRMARLTMLLALGNLWKARKRVIALRC